MRIPQVFLPQFPRVKGQRFQELSEQFETLAHDLGVCQDAKQRKQLLGKMKAIVEKMEELTRDQNDQSAAESGSATPPLTKAASS